MSLYVLCGQTSIRLEIAYNMGLSLNIIRLKYCKQKIQAERTE